MVPQLSEGQAVPQVATLLQQLLQLCCCLPTTGGCDLTRSSAQLPVAVAMAHPAGCCALRSVMVSAATLQPVGGCAVKGCLQPLVAVITASILRLNGASKIA
jgi:hypothetical protein